MNLTMDYKIDNIKASAINPFDKSYYQLQHKFDNQILKLLSDILRLNISLIKTSLITNLSSYENNSDNWILEQIVNGSAEISSTTFILTPHSPNALHYSYSLGTFRPQLYYKLKSLRENSNIYWAPFSSELWICLITAFVLLILTLTFILSREAVLPHEIPYDVLARVIDIQEDSDEAWTNHLQNTSKELLHKKEKWEVGEILLICLGAVSQQGSARDPSTNAARLLLLVLFALTVVGYTAYSASIISLISLFPSTEYEESGNVEKFSSKYKILLHRTNKICHYIEPCFNSTEFTSNKKGFDKVFKNEAVFIGDRDDSLTFLHQQNYSPDLRCSMGRVFLGIEYHRVLAVKKDYAYKEKINQNILRLKQFGLLERERKKIFNIKSPCSLIERSSQTHFVSFDKSDVNPVLNLFKVGFTISILVFITEKLVYYGQKKIRKAFKKPLKKEIVKPF